MACAIAEAMLDKEAHLDFRRTLALGAQLLGQEFVRRRAPECSAFGFRWKDVSKNVHLLSRIANITGPSAGIIQEPQPRV